MHKKNFSLILLTIPELRLFKMVALLGLRVPLSAKISKQE
jgi:hypothetical protein